MSNERTRMLRNLCVFRWAPQIEAQSSFTRYPTSYWYKRRIYLLRKGRKYDPNCL